MPAARCATARHGSGTPGGDRRDPGQGGRVAPPRGDRSGPGHRRALPRGARRRGHRARSRRARTALGQPQPCPAGTARQRAAGHRHEYQRHDRAAADRPGGECAAGTAGSRRGYDAGRVGHRRAVRGRRAGPRGPGRRPDRGCPDELRDGRRPDPGHPPELAAPRRPIRLAHQRFVVAVDHRRE